MPELVIIFWEDAAIHGSGTFNEKESKELGLINGVVCGWFVHEDKKQITIAMDHFPSEKTWRCLNSYPKSGITKVIRKVLKKK